MKGNSIVSFDIASPVKTFANVGRIQRLTACCRESRARRLIASSPKWNSDASPWLIWSWFATTSTITAHRQTLIG